MCCLGAASELLGAGPEGEVDWPVGVATISTPHFDQRARPVSSSGNFLAKEPTRSH